MLDVIEQAELPSPTKTQKRKLSAEQRALARRREAIRHELLYTPTLDRLNAIEVDPCFRGRFTDVKSRRDGLWVWDDESSAAALRRAALHAQFEELCLLREAELFEKFGEWPLAEGRIRSEVRKRLDANPSLS